MNKKEKKTWKKEGKKKFEIMWIRFFWGWFSSNFDSKNMIQFIQRFFMGKNGIDSSNLEKKIQITKFIW
jgi:hypothetical protein